jgi:hypothetical protein
MWNGGIIQAVRENLFGKPGKGFVKVHYGRPAPRFTTDPYKTWRHVPQVDPGASANAYEALGLVQFTHIGGGIPNRIPWQITQPPVMHAGLGVTEAGLGGLVAGQVYGQPLMDNPWRDTESVL